MSRAVAITATLLLLLGACSGGGSDSESGPTVLGAGDIVVELPDEEPTAAPTPTTPPADAPPAPSDDADATESGSDADAEEPGDETANDSDTDADAEPADDEDDGAIPLNDDEESFVEQAEGIFDAVDAFAECLADAGYEFIGVPEAGLPEDDPRVNPSYIQALGSCAAETNIQQAFEAADFSSDGLTPEEIEARNAGYVYFETCLTVRGWTIGEATPDQNGMLQLPDLFEPPAGETIVGTDDLRECLAEANENVQADLAAES